MDGKDATLKTEGRRQLKREMEKIKVEHSFSDTLDKSDRKKETPNINREDIMWNIGREASRVHL